ncbi:MAG: efflux RND transporter periplasmic adaptor subunit, partial [Nitratireductor sp.]
SSADGQSYVTVLTKDGPRPRDVETGIANRISIEIRSGLEAGEIVVTGTETGSSESSSRRGPPGFL